MKTFSSIPPMVRIPLKFGLVGSILAIAIMLVLFYSGRHPIVLPPYFDNRILIFLIFIYFSIREFKDYYNGGYLHFWQGMIVGVIVYLTVGIMGGLFILAFSSFEATFLSEYIVLVKQSLMDSKDILINGPQKVTITEEEFQNQLNLLDETTPLILAVNYFIWSCIIGFFIPLLYSVLFRRVER